MTLKWSRLYSTRLVFVRIVCILCVQSTVNVLLSLCTPLLYMCPFTSVFCVSQPQVSFQVCCKLLFKLRLPAISKMNRTIRSKVQTFGSPNIQYLWLVNPMFNLNLSPSFSLCCWIHIYAYIHEQTLLYVCIYLFTASPAQCQSRVLSLSPRHPPWL